MTVTVKDIERVMEEIAPTDLAESWDNVGLQVGQMDWPVSSIQIALDPSAYVVTAACAQKISLLITHHPLLFRPLARIDFSTPVGMIIRMAWENRMAILAAHTNLDSVQGGLNDLLAQKLGLSHLRPLRPAQPNQGSTLLTQKDTCGIGRLGALPQAVSLSALAELIKTKMNLTRVSVAGDLDMPVKQVALCTGSGASLMKDFFQSEASVYISGDLRYHDARSVEDAGLGLIDIGHFASEHIMVHDLRQRLQECCTAKGYDVQVEACQLEKNPFMII
jgi:dinuclear metal center YbgI/SA1388 family protein